MCFVSIAVLATLVSEIASLQPWNYPCVSPGFEKEYAKLPVAPRMESSNTLMPHQFNVIDNWAYCGLIAAHVTDQGACGSCWAIAAAGAFSDRYCIFTQGKDLKQFSAFDTMSCCKDCYNGTNGCGGGEPFKALSWFMTTGVVTSFNYAVTPDQTGCQPYHPFPLCSMTCQQGYTVNSYAKDKRKSKGSWRITGQGINDTVLQMQSSIQSGGSLVAIMYVYPDFQHYTGGVYKWNNIGSSMGPHAVRIIGWAVDQKTGEAHWNGVNSWGRNWGVSGQFKIALGRNECGIESSVVAPIFH